MAEKSTIEWTDATWNPITGCTLVSDGCRYCYAATLAAGRLQNHPSRKGLARMNAAGEAKFTGEVRFNEEWLDQPLRWRRPRMVFVCAHGDLFHESVPDEWIDRVFAVMALAPHHTFQVLTKRPARARAYLSGIGNDHVGDRLNLKWRKNAIADAAFDRYGEKASPMQFGWPLPNVWIGTSVEDQAAADARLPDLLETPASVRFLSAEPLLGPVDLSQYLRRIDGRVVDPTCDFCGERHEGDCTGLDWVIVGGESGPHARPMHPDWPRAIRDQCEHAGVAFFFKQWGEWVGGEVYEENGKGGLTRSQAPSEEAFYGCPSHWWHGDAFGGTVSIRAGKKAAGRLLDGREWSQMPGGRDDG